MSTLYIRLPSKAVAESVEHWLSLPCAFAATSQSGAIERESIASLSDLASAVAAAQRVVLLLAASDVTILRVKAPPLSAAKLKLALPNLVEDQLMTDASECVVAAGELIDGLRTAAVVQRGWLEILVKTFMALGARNLVALPSQLCIPYHEGRAAAAISEHGADLDLALRLTQAAGIGLAIMPDNHQAAAAEVLAALRAVAPSLPVTLYLPQARIGEFQEALRAGAEGAEQQEISLLADTWPNWIGAAGKNSLNLMAGMGGASGTQFNWRQWRWPIALAASVLLINMIALNVDWWRMRREASSLRSGMIQVYKSTYPKETVILDALVQMQRKVGESERNAGQAAPDDFGQIAASFAQALNAQLREQKAAAGAIASLEYREHGLLIHLKPDTKLSTEKMKNALAARNLSLVSPSSGVWQIRSAQ